MASSVKGDAPKSEGIGSQVSDTMDKGINWVCDTLQEGNWKSVALGTAMVGLSLILMLAVFPHMLDFSNLGPTSAMPIMFGAALGTLGLRGIFSPLLKNVKCSETSSKVAKFTLAGLVPFVFLGLGIAMMAFNAHHFITNGCFWTGAVLTATGGAIGFLTLSNLWNQRHLIHRARHGL